MADISAISPSSLGISLIPEAKLSDVAYLVATGGDSVVLGKVDKEDFLNTVVDELSSKFNFGSAAFTNSDDYAPIGHLHDYTMFSIYAVAPAVSAEVSDNPDDKTIFQSDKAHIKLDPENLAIDDVKIGSVAFIYKLTNVLETNGWYFADGRPLPISVTNNDGTYKFSDEVINFFGMSSDGLSITLPDLRTFLRGWDKDNPFESRPLDNIDQQVGIGQHSHKIIISENGTSLECDAKFKIGVSRNGMSLNNSGNSKAITLHNGSNMVAYKLKIKAVNNDGNKTLKTAKTTTQISDSSAEYEPPHWTLQAMVYVGERKKQTT